MQQQEKLEDNEVPDWEHLADKAASARDLILAGAGLVYVFGFLIWAMHAYSLHIGLVNANQVQYISAGLIPLVFTICIYQLNRTVARNASVMPTERLFKDAKVATGCIGAPVFVLITVSAVVSRGYNLKLLFLSCVMLVVIIIISVVLTILTEAAHDRVHSGPIWLHINHGIFVLCLLFMGVGLYSLEIYPCVPQEFGGVLPRCAVIEIKRLDLSYGQRDILLPAAERVTPADRRVDLNPVVESVPLDVLYDDGNVVDIRPHGVTNGPVYELSRSNITSIVWYGYNFPKSVHSAR